MNVSALKVGVLLFMVGLNVLIFYYRKSIARLAKWGYFGIFWASLLGNATILAPSPVFALVMVEGWALNPYWVGLISAIGGALGEITGYVTGYAGQVLVGEHPRIEEWIQTYGFLAIVLLSATPNPFFDVAGILAGLNHFPLEQFVAATFLGTLIKYTLLALTGRFIFKK
jgi:membrane protein YqaA with SNARE-associated domain